MKKESINSITHGHYTADISNIGASLVALKYLNNNLIEERLHARYFNGEILAPWPNRIADGKYSYNGEDFQLNINEIHRNNALHGLVFDKYWNVFFIEDNKIILQITLNDRNSYPGILDIQIIYEIDDHGLLSTLSAINRDVIDLPYGASTHPYLMIHTVDSVNDYTLAIGASKVLLTDGNRLLPTKLVDVLTADLDFRTPAKIGSRSIDHAFKRDPKFDNSVSINSDSGAGVLISFSDSAKWIQIHTADRNGGIDGRKSLAVEPMTCPPDAFNSGIDLVSLKPGEVHVLSWRICAAQ